VKTKGENIGIDIYTCHTANVHDDSEEHNKQVDSIRNTIIQHSIGPVIWTGDFNAEVEFSRTLKVATRDYATNGKGAVYIV
jgi:endonuclease/exonuclease/phosphatase (EEP) superfamily protein YafD